MLRRLLALLFTGLAAYTHAAEPAAHADSTRPTSNAAVPIRPSDARLLDALRDAMTQTPYSALVISTRIEIRPVRDPDPTDDLQEERHIVHAKVLETFRGRKYRHIGYEMVVEKGETPMLESEPEIVALCVKNGQLYWPGVGTSFPGRPEIVAHARRVRGELRRHGAQTFALCD